MSANYKLDLKRIPASAATEKAQPSFASGPLELNAIYTGPEWTAAALAYAQSLALDLGTRIRLRAAIEVPLRLPLERPQVSVAFLQEKLRELISAIAWDGFDPTIHIYACRDRLKALLLSLIPNSIVIIGAPKRLWPTPESRLAWALRRKGYRVVLIDSRPRFTSARQVPAR